MSIAFFNNKFIDKREVTINLEDRGYQFGDGIYEVIGVYNTRPFKLKEHLERLVESAEKVHLSLNYTMEELEQIIVEIKEKNNLENGMLYLQVTRGAAPRNHPFPPATTEPTTTAYSIEVDRQAPVVYEEGVTALLYEDIRWLRCDIKSLNLLPNILAKQAAIGNNAYEAIFYRANGIVTEGCSTNLFMVKDRVVFTHPANNYVLNGITRQTIIDICKEANIQMIEIAFSTEFLLEADEVFFSGTYNDIVPVKEILNETTNYQAAGKITKKLMEKLEALTRSQSPATLER